MGYIDKDSWVPADEMKLEKNAISKKDEKELEKYALYDFFEWKSV